MVKNPAKLENIEFIEPTKKEYKLGEELDLTGGKLLLTYDDGAVKEIELKSSMVSGYDKEKVGKQTVTITFNEVEYTYDIEVIKEDIPPMVEPSTPETSNPTDTSQNLTELTRFEYEYLKFAKLKDEYNFQYCMKYQNRGLNRMKKNDKTGWKKTAIK